MVLYDTRSRIYGTDGRTYGWVTWSSGVYLGKERISTCSAFGSELLTRYEIDVI